LATAGRLGGRGVADLKDIVQLIEDDLAKVESSSRSRSSPTSAWSARSAATSARAAASASDLPLLLLGCRLCGYRGDRAVLLASVVEFIHTATLLHDDIIDQATVRRGRRSVNSRWGNDVTVLAGDFLYTKSMSMALSQDNLKILRLLSDVTLRMIEGEILEIERNGDVKIGEADHLDIIRRKTADLFSVSMRIGAILGEAGEAKEKALASYGENLGDLLPDGRRPPGPDRRREGAWASRWPTTCARARSRCPSSSCCAAAEGRGPRPSPRSWPTAAFGRVSREELLKLAREHGALDEARALAERYAAAARADLAGFERSPYREALEALPEFILARDH
jgi:octaprenyl-diphosphate synthase